VDTEGTRGIGTEVVIALRAVRTRTEDAVVEGVLAPRFCVAVFHERSRDARRLRRARREGPVACLGTVSPDLVELMQSAAANLTAVVLAVRAVLARLAQGVIIEVDSEAAAGVGAGAAVAEAAARVVVVVAILFGVITYSQCPGVAQAVVVAQRPRRSVVRVRRSMFIRRERAVAGRAVRGAPRVGEAARAAVEAVPTRLAVRVERTRTRPRR